MSIDLASCDPVIDDCGSLRFVLPGGIGSACEIATWESGCQARTIRAGRARAGSFWTLRLLATGCREGFSPKIDAFFAQIPPDIRDALAAFEFGQGPMLSCLAQGSAARDLFLGNPNLLWLVMVGVHDGLIRPSAVTELCREKQIDILRKLTWPVSKATLRLLWKTVIQDGTLGEARTLCDTLRNLAIVNATAHEKKVTLRLLTILSRHPILVRRHLVGLLNDHLDSNVGQTGSVGLHVAETLTDIHRMAVQLRIRQPDRAVRQCQTVDEIYELHDRWVKRMNRLFCERSGNLRAAGRRRPPPERAVAEPVEEDTSLALPLRFPAQPFPDTPEILAIRTAEDLLSEGRSQSNCVASYAPYIASGKLYVYRVLRPQRATLEVAWTRSGWRLGQVKLARNKQPSQLTHDFVEAWFSRVVGG